MSSESHILVNYCSVKIAMFLHGQLKSSMGFCKKKRKLVHNPEFFSASFRLKFDWFIKLVTWIMLDNFFRPIEFKVEKNKENFGGARKISKKIVIIAFVKLFLFIYFG